ncbi:MAG: hypothetical protein WD942_07375 [Dehalococcoidia bacterium]
MESSARIGALDVFSGIAREPGLRPFVVWEWRWQIRSSVLRADVRFEDGGIRVEVIRESTRTTVASSVPVVWTPCRFGGERPWFQCPECRRTVMHVYVTLRDYLACRACAGLTYASQQEGITDRRMRRARKLRRRVGGNGDLIHSFPAKPPRMHHRRYERLRAQGERTESAIWAAEYSALLALQGRVAR